MLYRSPMPFRLLLTASALLAVAAGLPHPCRAAERAEDASSNTSYANEIRPLIETYCLKCHGPEKAKGDVNFATVKDESAVLRDPKFWQTVLQQLRERNMPPDGK